MIYRNQDQTGCFFSLVSTPPSPKGRGDDNHGAKGQFVTVCNIRYRATSYNWTFLDFRYVVPSPSGRGLG